MAESQTCDACQHYWPSVPNNAGNCDRIIDGNGLERIRSENAVTFIPGCDNAGTVSVGPKFGCIHWAEKK